MTNLTGLNTTERKNHWDKIYNEMPVTGRSWYQRIPKTSLEFVKELGLPVTAKIFDNGAGESYFVDHLLEMGYKNITVLDISQTAIGRVKKRIGRKADSIKWIIADEAKCDPGEQYDLWHDRAAFHFLTEDEDINNYILTIKNCIKPGGYLVIGTFSEDGPKKCSGIEIKQYSCKSMTERFSDCFDVIKCINVEHKTPFNTIQSFTFCCFKRKLH